MSSHDILHKPLCQWVLPYGREKDDTISIFYALKLLYKFVRKIYETYLTIIPYNDTAK